jgi:hypothetical protein
LFIPFSQERVSVETRYQVKKGVLLALALIAATGALVMMARSRDGDAVPFPSGEKVRKVGFAVWPEDTVREARAACKERVDHEPWRRSAVNTTVTFGRERLGYDEGEVMAEQTTVRDDRATVWLYDPGIFLPNIFYLRKAGDCWFITGAVPREDGEPTIAFSHEDGATKMYIEERGFVEAGFGARIERSSLHSGRRFAWILPEPISSEGHYLTVGYDRKGHGESVRAGSLPAPPQTRTQAVVVPRRSEPIWDDIVASGQRRSCRVQFETKSSPRRTINWLLEWFFSDAMPSGPYPDVLHVGRRGKIGDRVELIKRSDVRWLLIVDGIRYEVILDRVLPSCWPVRSITARKRPPILRRVWADTGGVTMDVRWGRAHRGEFSLDFGGAAGSQALGFLHRIPSPISFYVHGESPKDQPGYVSAILFRKGRIVNAQALRLPPL